MFHRVRTNATVAISLGAVLVLTPTPSHAIPTAGDYDVTGLIMGTFQSDGTQLTAWELGGQIEGLDYQDIHWASFYSGPERNDTDDFIQSTVMTTSFAGSYRLEIRWDKRRGIDKYEAVVVRTERSGEVRGDEFPSIVGEVTVKKRNAPKP